MSSKTTFKPNLYHLFAVLSLIHFLVIPFFQAIPDYPGLIIRISFFPTTLFVVLGIIFASNSINKNTRIFFPVIVLAYFVSEIIGIMGVGLGSDYGSSFGFSFYRALGFVPNGFLPYFSFDYRGILSMLQGFTGVAVIVVSIVTMFIREKQPTLLNLSSETNLIHTNPSVLNSALSISQQTKGAKMAATNSGAQWVVKIPGQPDQPVDTATVQMWARSGVVRSDTLIVEVASGMTYTASQIPGVFSDKSYVTALLLSFFLGSLGVDRFYLGHTGIGIGKLLTFGGCGIWSLIDFIMIAMRKVADSNGNPLA